MHIGTRNTSILAPFVSMRWLVAGILGTGIWGMGLWGTGLWGTGLWGTGTAAACDKGGFGKGGGFGKMAGGFGGGSMPFAYGMGAGQFADQQLKHARMMRKAKASQARLQAARQAQLAGDVRRASQLYLRVALAQPQDQLSSYAKQALVEMAVEGRQQLAALERSAVRGDRSVLKELDRLAATYQNIPLVSREIGARRRRFKQHLSPGLGKPEQLLAATSRPVSRPH